MDSYSPSILPYVTGGGGGDAKSQIKNWPIVSSFDDNYLWAWIVSTFSGCTTSKHRPTRIIFSSRGGVSPKNRKLIEDVSKWLQIDTIYQEIELPEDLPVGEHFTPIVYSRLVAAEILNGNFLYMDVDILLSEGWDALLSLQPIPPGFVSRGVLEPSSVIHLDLQNEAILKAGTNYFNAGIMLIDADAFKFHDFQTAWKILAKEYQQRHFKYADQCILNYMLAGMNISLSPNFNYFPAMWQDNLQEILPEVVHFAGQRKPWTIPAIERYKLFNVIRGHKFDRFFFVNYWRVERDLLISASKYSNSLGKELHSLRKSGIKPIDISFSRIKSRLRQISYDK